MAIVTISRGSHSGGAELAELLAKRLGYRSLSREILVEAAQAHGVDADRLARAIETPLRFWDRFGNERRRYLAFIQHALLEAVASDDVVYHGHAGHLLLRGLDHVLCVRIVAPLERRLALVRQQNGLELEDAAQYIEQQDRARAQWTRFLYHADWTDPHLYDLVVNMERLDLESVCDGIESVLQGVRLRSTAEKRRLSLASELRASHVRVALALDEGTKAAEVEVEAVGETVKLRGKLSGPELASAVLSIARKAAGEATIDSTDLRGWPVPD